MLYFIVNPNSRCGKGERVWKRLKRHLEFTGVAYEAYVTEGQGDARTFASHLTEGNKEPKIIVTVGGDGTINEVLDGLSFGGPVTLGYIPAGSGNDLARSLGLPKNPKKCLKKILSPQYHKLLDYGVLTYGKEEVHHRRFMVSAGIGFDAAVCHNLHYSKTRRFLNKIHMGRLSYVLVGLKQLAQARPAKGYLLLDGVQKVELNHIYFISSHIHPYEGGGFKFAPRADAADGQLTVCVMHHSSKAKLLPILADALFKKRNKKYKGMRNYNCREVVIHTERPMAVHVDGESCFCQQDLEIRCIPKKIRMIV
ncbi:MAG: diacylglycerol/lipid kinase family protein [Lachnospiraceae bacterium]